MNARPWLRTLRRPFASWLGEPHTPAPPLAGVAPPAPVFGHRRALDTSAKRTAAHAASSSLQPDPATRAVEQAHALALEFRELERGARAARGLALVEVLRRVAREPAAEERAGARFRPALALAWGGRLFVGDEPRRWTEEAAARLAAALTRSVAADGLVAGGGVRDHIEALSDVLECRALLLHETDVERHDEQLESLLQAAADLRTPGRRTVDLPGAPQCLAAWHRMTGRRLEPRPCFALEASGLYGVRGEKSLVVIHAGAPGRTAALCLDWTVDGRRILVAEGVEPCPREREDVLALDGTARGAQRPGRVERTRLEQLEHTIVLEVTHHGYASLRGKPVHHRRVTATAHGLSIEDQVTGGAGQQVCGELVLDPQVEVRARGASLVLVAGPVTALLETRHGVEVERAWWLGEDGEWRSTRRLVLHYGGAPCHGSFRIDRLVPKATLTSFLRRESLSLDRMQAQARASA